ncbi:hypothetical protein DAMDJJ_14750 [Cupriavidus necator]
MLPIHRQFIVEHQHTPDRGCAYCQPFIMNPFLRERQRETEKVTVKCCRHTGNEIAATIYLKEIILRDKISLMS